MSFRDDEIAEEFATSVGGRVEFFGSDGYSFRRLGKVEALDAKLVEALRMRRWKLAHPDRCAELKAKSIAHRMEVDAEGQRAMRRRRKKKWQAKNPAAVRAMSQRAWSRRKDRSDVKAAALARAQAHYAKAKADPAKLEALRAYKREWARKKAAERKAAP